jgi:very-short-patch-repair endonuclease
VHGETFDYTLAEYQNNSKSVVIISRHHGQFSQTPTHHFEGAGCPNCYFKAEARIAELLKTMEIDFEQQYKLGDKRYDFFLPDYNLLLERDGQQHYFTIGLFANGDESYLEKQASNDALKTSLAKSAGYKIARLPFWLTPCEEKREVNNILYHKPTFPDVPKRSQAITQPPPN